MYNSKSYKVQFPLYFEVERFHRAVKGEINDIDRLFKEKIADLDQRRLSDSKLSSFHEGSYDQDIYEPALTDLKISNNDKFIRLLKDVFSKFETSLREIAIQISSEKDVSNLKQKEKSKIETFKQFIIDKSKIDLSPFDKKWSAIDELRKNQRCHYEHEGNDLKQTDEKLKMDILKMNDETFDYLITVMKLLSESK